MTSIALGSVALIFLSGFFGWVLGVLNGVNDEAERWRLAGLSGKPIESGNWLWHASAATPAEVERERDKEQK